MSAERKQRIALAATSQALQDGVEAVRQFNLRSSDPEARALMATVIAHRMGQLGALRDMLMSSSNPKPNQRHKI
jgi:hypothetical protein